MRLNANGGDYGQYTNILVVFNATDQQMTFTDGNLTGLHLRLHPVQRSSSDPLTRQSSFNSKAGSATVAGLTTAVFVSEDR